MKNKTVIDSIVKLYIYLNLLLFSSEVKAQISVDSTLGSERSIVNQKQLKGRVVTNITKGARRGNNLFHGFKNFNVKGNESVEFIPLKGVKNIFVRVVGKKPSNIFGVLGVKEKINSSKGTNLILINPNGIKFGGSAKLNLSGSFLGTTAKSINFSNNVLFEASPGELSSILDLGSFSNLQFNNNTGNIIINGISNDKNSTLTPGKTLAFIGNGIFLDNAKLSIPGGKIELGSVGNNSRVEIRDIKNQWEFDYLEPNNLNVIHISNNSIVRTDGGENLSGKISLLGDEIKLLDASQIISDSDVFNPTKGFIFVQANNLLTLKQRSIIRSTGAGLREPVSIRIIADRLNLENGLIDSRAFNSSNSGDINITVNQDLTVAGNFGEISSTSSGLGRGGEIAVFSKSLELKDGGQILSNSREAGDGGRIKIVADNIKISGIGINQDRKSSITTAASGVTTGKAGDIIITAQNLSIFNAGEISVAANAKSRGAGSLRIDAANEIIIDGSNSKIRGNNNSLGVGGNIVLRSNLIQVSNSGEINVSSIEPDNISSNISKAGNIRLSASNIILENSGLLSATTDGGQGDITLSSNIVYLNNNSNIETNAIGDVPGGNISIDVGALVGLNNSDISASAQNERGGSISVNSLISPIDIQEVDELTPNSDIISTSNISGLNGSININVLIDSNQLSTFNPVQLGDPTVTLENSCSYVADSQQDLDSKSRFSQIGRASSPLHPSTLRQSSNILSDWSTPHIPSSDSLIVSTLLHKPIIHEAKGWIQGEQGQITLVSQDFISSEINKNFSSASNYC